MEYLVKTDKLLWPMRFSSHPCAYQAQMGVLCPCLREAHLRHLVMLPCGSATRPRRRHLATAATDHGGAAWNKSVNVLPGNKPITDHLWAYIFPGWMDWPTSTIDYEALVWVLTTYPGRRAQIASEYVGR